MKPFCAFSPQSQCLRSCRTYYSDPRSSEFVAAHRTGSYDAHEASAEGMMSSLELPHWLMIAGTALVVAGFIGVLVSGKKPQEVEPPPDEPIDTPHQQMPPLPSLLDSRPRS